MQTRIDGTQAARTVAAAHSSKPAAEPAPERAMSRSKRKAPTEGGGQAKEGEKSLRKPTSDSPTFGAGHGMHKELTQVGRDIERGIQEIGRRVGEFFGNVFGARRSAQPATVPAPAPSSPTPATRSADNELLRRYGPGNPMMDPGAPMVETPNSRL